MSKVIKNSGWWIIAGLSLAPFLLWIFELPLALRFSNTPLFLRSLGDIFGLCGMAMFSLVIILSARLKFFERFFNGINESYTAHHLFGGLAFCLLLFHPLLLAYNYFLISSRTAALFLLPGANLAQNFGTFGLFVMIITLVITFYTKLKYQIWKFTHKFLGFAFIFAFLHTFLVGYDVASNQALRIYLFVLGITAIILYFYRTILAGYFVRSYNYSVKDIKLLPDKIWEIEFQSVEKEIKFVAGQFVFLKFKNSLLSKEFHPFTLSSAPGSPLKIGIKELGDYTHEISKLKIGDTAVVEGPFGAFNFRNYSNKNQVWIAGGIGITPFLGMIRSLTNKDLDYKIDLYYSVKDENCLAFKEEIEELIKINKNIRAFFWQSNIHGFINAGSIRERTQDLINRDVFICGPGVMMAALKEQFLGQGLKKKQIHIEEFGMY